MSYKNFSQPSTLNPQPVDPSTLISQPSTFSFPQSVQSDLFNYLKPEQQEFVKPILRVLKKSAQEELCTSLLDYLETGEIIPPADFTLGALFFYITRTGGGFPKEPENKKILRPLHYRGMSKVEGLLSNDFPAIARLKNVIQKVF